MKEISTLQLINTVGGDAFIDGACTTSTVVGAAFLIFSVPTCGGAAVVWGLVELGCLAYSSFGG